MIATSIASQNWKKEEKNHKCLAWCTYGHLSFGHRFMDTFVLNVLNMVCEMFPMCLTPKPNFQCFFNDFPHLLNGSQCVQYGSHYVPNIISPMLGTYWHLWKKSIPMILISNLVPRKQKNDYGFRSNYSNFIYFNHGYKL
jgi:hypothetical protein